MSEGGVFLQVGFNRRFDPAHRSVRDAVASGAIGDLHLVRITSRDPAPPPLDYVARLRRDLPRHDDPRLRHGALRHGHEVDEVYARGEVRVDPAIGEAGDIDTAVVSSAHADGTLTVIDNSRRAVYGYDQRVEAFGSNGHGGSGNPPQHTGFARTGGRHARDGTPLLLPRAVPDELHRRVDAFERSVRGGSSPSVTGVDGRRALVLGLAARRSATEGRPVRVSEMG